MRLFNAPASIIALLLTTALAKPYPVHDAELEQLHSSNSSSLVDRQLAAVPCPAPGVSCGYYSQLCCAAGQSCGEDPSNKQAFCQAGSGGGGGWKTYTTTWVETVGLVTYTSVYSTYVGGAVATPSSCTGVQVACGSICCPGGYYCDLNKQCKAAVGGSSGGILPTVPVTYTGRPTATVPFQTPIPTGAAGVPIPVENGGGGLSGGAIAGIVIGVILGILLLLLLCLFCCARALFDTIAAIFGFGKKKKHTHEETYVEEHHHSSGGAAAAGGGRWYGQGRPARPSRVGSEKKSGLAKGAGVAAALGGLALMLGLKRKNDRKHDDKSTTVSGSSYYYSDYTSSSSASSDDRRTRTTRHSSRR